MTLQELFSQLNFHISAFTGEQVDEAIGAIINGSVAKSEENAADSAAQAAKSLEETKKIEQDLIDKGAFVGDANTRVSEYYEAYQAGRPCFMKRSVGTAGGAHMAFWVLDYAYQSQDIDYAHAYFYRVHQDGTVYSGILREDRSFTVITAEAKIFVGNADTTAQEFFDALNSGRACFMIRTHGGSGEWVWVMSNAVRDKDSYKAYFYNIGGSGKVSFGVLKSDGTFTYETASGGGGGDVELNTFVGDANTTAQEFYEAFSAGKACFMIRSMGDSGDIVWVMRNAGGGSEGSYTAFFYNIDNEGRIHYGTLYSDGTFTYETASSGGESTVFVGDANTTAQEFNEAFRAGKACFLRRSAFGGYTEQWTMYNYKTKVDGISYAYFYLVDKDGVTYYAYLDSNGEWHVQKSDNVKDKADASTTTKAGTYGRYNSSTTTYYVPSITVNEQGVLTGASQSYLGLASSKSNGLLDSAMYNHVYDSAHLERSVQSKAESYVDTEISLSFANCKMKTLYAGGATLYIPSVYGVYVYNADDDSFISVPIIKTKGTSGGTGTVYVNFDSAYLDSSGSATFVVLYEKIYGTSGSSM